MSPSSAAVNTACTFGCCSAALTSIEHDLRVRVRRAQHGPVQHPGQVHVVDEPTLPADEPRVLLAANGPERHYVSPFASNTATFTVLHAPHLIRTRLVICSSPIEAASTLPHSTHT